MFLILLGIFLATLVYFKMEKVNHYWKEKGVPCVKPWPVFGNMAASAFKRRPLVHLIDDMYKAYPDKRYVGFYQYSTPTLLIRDPELLKTLSVKEFDTFPDHNPLVDPEVDPLWGKNLFALKSKDGWHSMRATLSPIFTSSKLRSMFLLMQQCSEQCVRYFQSQNGIVSVELKEVFSKFTTDVIATTAFGVTCDSFKDPNNTFYVMGTNAAKFGGLRFFGYCLSPTLMKLLRVKLLNKKSVAFFKTLVKETIKIREEKKIMRPDMINLLMEARKGCLEYEKDDGVTDSGFSAVQDSEMGKRQRRLKAELTENDIVAQALIFFIGGFDTASRLMSFITYELAMHPDIQKRLRQEVDEVSKVCKGQLTYDAVLGMKYLDQVVSETLRMRLPVAFVDRKSAKPFTIEPELPGEKPLHLEAGSLLCFPLYSFHMDPKYYPDPEKFDPERFSDENKQNVKPFTYLPFGVGPRSCIASRFGLLESKLIIVELLRKFEFIPTEKTMVNVTFRLTHRNLFPAGGLWLAFKSRSSPS